MKSSTVASPFVINMLEGAKIRGHNINQLLLKCAISPNVLHLPGSRVTFEQMSRLSLSLVELLGDENYGLTDKPQRGNSFKHACYSAIHAETIGEALKLFAEFSNIMEGSLVHEVRQQSESCQYLLRKRPNATIRNRYAFEHNLIILYRTLCWMANTRIPMPRVDLEHPAPDYVSEYRYLFYGTPVRFSQHNNALIFNNDSLKLQNVRNIEDLKRFLKQVPLTLLSQTIQTNDLSSQIRRWLERQLQKQHASPGIDSAAAQFELHPQTLRRELKKSGTSYQDIKMETRRDMAINLIQDHDISIQAIAFQLDFSEPSAFIRAFKQWTGLTPLAYRKLA